MFILIPGRRNLVVKEWTRCIFLYLVEETLWSRDELDVYSYTWQKKPCCQGMDQMCILVPGRRNLVVKEGTRCVFLYLVKETLLSRDGLDVFSYIWQKKPCGQGRDQMFILKPCRRDLVVKGWTRCLFLYLVKETLLSREGLDVYSYT